MNNSPLNTVLIGFGKIAALYTNDDLMNRYYRYSTHAQVLQEHPDFNWQAVVDPSPIAQQHAKTHWKMPHVFATIEELKNHFQPEVAVIATPPKDRLALITQLPSLRAILIEKPLGLTLSEAIDIIELCNKNSILIQVNFLRRGDRLYRHLANNLLYDLIGNIQAVFGVYGNGLFNNGSHLIDLIQMLCGEITAARAINACGFIDGPINEDINIPFTLICKDQFLVNIQPIRFSHYREGSLDIWGENGRISILQEGLKTFHYARAPHRATSDAYEIMNDTPKELETTIGDAFYHIYSNLADSIRNSSSLWSSGENALQTMHILNAIQTSYQNDGELIRLKFKKGRY